MSAVATLLTVAGVVALLLLNRDRQQRTSNALWIPTIWISIAASRQVSMWLQVAPTSSADLYLEGSPLDRNVFTALLIAGLLVLIYRGRRTAKFASANRPLLVFLAYCVLSCLWSDFPAVAFKRWIKLLGDVVMVLAVLTEQDPRAGMTQLLTRIACWFMPVSILLIKYYPDMGRTYSRWEGTMMLSGAATDKNMLGVGCLILGLPLMWCLLQEMSRKRRGRTGAIVAKWAVLVMMMWLLLKSHSMTSLCCFVLASGLMAAASVPRLARNRAVIHMLVGSAVSVVFFVLFLNAGASLLQTLGRDPTLTGRTELWETVLSLTGNQWVGTGFESFWLGPRLEKIWSMSWWRPNEAHNGYLEIFLTLGWIGIALLSWMILTGYRNIVAMLRSDPEGAKLRLAYLVVGVAYNLTESAFKAMHPVWIALLLAVVAIPKTRETRTRTSTEIRVASVSGAGAAIHQPA